MLILLIKGGGGAQNLGKPAYIILARSLGAFIPMSGGLSVGLSVSLSVHPKNYKKYKTLQNLTKPFSS